MELSKLLTEALEAQGYQVMEPGPVEGRSGTTYAVSLIATREGREHLVDVVSHRAVRGRDLKALSSIAKDTGYRNALLFALQGVEPEARSARVDTVRVVDRDQVSSWLGELLLARLDEDDELDVPEDQALELLPLRVDPATLPEPAPPEGQGSQPPSSPEAGNGHHPSHGPPEPSPSPKPAPQAPAATEEHDPTGEQVPEDERSSASAEEDGSDAQWLTDPPEPPEEDPEPDHIDPTEVADDGSDAEWLTDPPEPPEEDPEPDRIDPTEVADDGSDAEWLTDPPEPAQEDAEPDRIDPTEVADDGSDAEWLGASPEAKAAKPAEETRIDPTEVADDGSDAELLPSRPRAQEPGPDPPSSQQAPDPPAAAPRERTKPAFLAGQVMRPRVDRRDALRKAEEVLFSSHEATLELLPFHVIAYRCRLTGEGKSRDHEGELWVSALTGNAVDAPEVDLVEQVEAPSEKVDVEVDPDQARKAATQHLSDNLEIRDQVSQDFGESAIMERIRFTPDPDTVQLKYRGTVYAPRWRVDGENGTTFVDAVTGELVSAKTA